MPASDQLPMFADDGDEPDVPVAPEPAPDLAPDPELQARLLRQIAELRASILEVFARRPVVLLPVAVVPAFPLGSTDLDVDGTHHVVDAMTILAPCRAISLLGLPALSVPAGRSREGLPVGVQVVGRPGDDETILRVAQTIADAVNVR